MHQCGPYGCTVCSSGCNVCPSGCNVCPSSCNVCSSCCIVCSNAPPPCRRVTGTCHFLALLDHSSNHTVVASSSAPPPCRRAPVPVLALSQEWLERRTFSRPHDLRTLSNQDLCTQLYVCGKLHVMPPAPWLKQALHESCVKMIGSRGARFIKMLVDIKVQRSSGQLAFTQYGAVLYLLRVLSV
eukprot:scaffold86705_cov24-Tisochrysis_lutea.AAC.1